MQRPLRPMTEVLSIIPAFSTQLKNQTVQRVPKTKTDIFQKQTAQGPMMLPQLHESLCLTGQAWSLVWRIPKTCSTVLLPATYPCAPYPPRPCVATKMLCSADLRRTNPRLVLAMLFRSLRSVPCTSRELRAGDFSRWCL